MRIELLPNLDQDVVAYELLSGGREGEFYLSAAEEVWYRHPASRPLFANPTAAAFRQAADAWLKYCETVSHQDSEDAQLDCVNELRRGLTEHGSQLGRADAFWAVILDQADSGNL